MWSNFDQVLAMPGNANENHSHLGAVIRHSWLKPFWTPPHVNLGVFWAFMGAVGF